MNQNQQNASARLLSNSFFNGLGIALPILVGFVTIPKIIDLLGTDAFGILTIVWMILGYFSLFDFGLGKAITKIVSEKLSIADDTNTKVSKDLSTNLIFIFFISLLVSVLIFIFNTSVADFLFNVGPDLHQQIIISLNWIALGLPAVTMTSVLKGYLEAFKDFKALNLFQIALGLFNFISPLLVVYSEQKLADAIFMLMVIRWVFLFIHFWRCKKITPEKFSFEFDKNILNVSLKFGGWVTVSSVVGPIMVYFDRFLLSAVMPSQSIAYYTTPFEITSRLLLIPQAVSRALFPEISSSHLKNKKKILKTSLVAISLVMLPAVCFLFFFAEIFLTWWLGPDFGIKSSGILQTLSLGVFINSLAWIPFTEIQSSNRPDLIAKLHFTELIFYFPSLYFFISKWGLIGVAICWTLRVTIDAFLLFYLNSKLQIKSSKINLKTNISI